MGKVKEYGQEQNTIRRQFEMLRMLRRNSRITAQQLRKNLEDCGYVVTDRTVQRDLRDLSTIFPIMSDERSKPHGWQWKPDAPLCNLGGLTIPEALAFQMLARFGKNFLPLSIADTLQPYFSDANDQLKQSLGSGAARNWTGKIRSVPPSQPLLPAKISVRIQQDVHEALMKNCCLRIRYRSEKAKDYVVHPLGLIEHGKSFYLCVRYDAHDDPRLLAMHRISSAQVLADMPAVSPSGFDLDTYIADGAMGFGEVGKQIFLKIRMFNRAGVHLNESRLSPDQEITQHDIGEMTVTATVNLTERLRWWLFGFGANVEVIEPSELREEIRNGLLEASARYG